MKYQGAEWMRRSGFNLSPLGELVAEIVGFVWRGIYHLSRRDLEASDFADQRFVRVRVPGGLSTWDYPQLAELVALCYQNGLRMEIQPRGQRHLMLAFCEPAFPMPTLSDLADGLKEEGVGRAPADPPEGGRDAG
jgi:hypothetical protein